MIGDHLYTCWLWWTKKDRDVKWWSLVSFLLIILITTTTRMTKWILRDECSKKFYLWSLLWWNKNVMISDHCHWSLIIIIVISTSEPCLPSAPPQQWSPEHQDLYDQHHEIIFMKSQDNDHPDHSIRNHHDHDHYLDHFHLGPGLPGRLSLRSHCSLQLNRQAHVFSDQ